MWEEVTHAIMINLESQGVKEPAEELTRALEPLTGARGRFLLLCVSLLFRQPTVLRAAGIVTPHKPRLQLPWRRPASRWCSFLGDTQAREFPVRHVLASEQHETAVVFIKHR